MLITLLIRKSRVIILKKINNALIFIVSLISICFFVRDFNIGKTDRLLSDITVTLVLLIPKIVNKLFKDKINSEMEFIYIVFIILAHFLGSVVNLYKYIWWYDLFAHFLSGILTSILALIIMNWFKVYNDKNRLFNIIFIISFTLMIASFWEFLEYGADTFLNMNVQHSIETGVSDTMDDMLIANLGSFIVSFIYLVECKFLNNGFIKKTVSNLK